MNPLLNQAVSQASRSMHRSSLPIPREYRIPGQDQDASLVVSSRWAMLKVVRPNKSSRKDS